jgi:hypothetical protein
MAPFFQGEPDMSKYSYRVTEKRFHGGVLYEPGTARDVISTDEPFKIGTKGVTLISTAAAVKAIAKSRASTTKKTEQVANGNAELLAGKIASGGTPDFTGGAAKAGAGKKSNVVTL